jgi:hypothetical protein
MSNALCSVVFQQIPVQENNELNFLPREMQSEVLQIIPGKSLAFS